MRRNHLQSFSCSAFLWPWDHDWNSTAIFQPSLFTLVRKISRCTSISILALDTYQGELVVVVERPNLSWRKGMKENSKKGKRKRETKNGWPCEVFETVLNFTNAWNRLRPSNTTNQSDTHVQVSNYVIQVFGALFVIWLRKDMDGILQIWTQNKI